MKQRDIPKSLASLLGNKPASHWPAKLKVLIRQKQYFLSHLEIVKDVTKEIVKDVTQEILRRNLETR